MRVRVEASHVLPATPEVVFGFLTETSRWYYFWPNLIGVEGPEQWLHPGDHVRVRVRTSGGWTGQRLNLLEAVRPSVVRYYAVQPEHPDTTHEHHLDHDPGGCRLTSTVEFEGRSGWAGMRDRGFERALRRQLADAHQMLEAALKPAPVSAR